MKPALSLSVIEVKSSHKVGKDYDYDWYANDVIDNLIDISDLKRPEKKRCDVTTALPSASLKNQACWIKIKYSQF